MKTETPINIDDLSLEQVLALIDDSSLPPDFPKKKKRFKLLKLIYDVMGYDLTNDAILASLFEGNRELIIATAGGGKTTNSQIKIILEKIIRKNMYGYPLDGDRVLCLVYNTHNVEQMRIKHSDMVSRLYLSGIQGLEIDSIIRPHTMHSFCEYWKREFASSCGLENWRLLEESEANTMLKQCVDVAKKKFSSEDIIMVSNVQNLYNYLKENLLPFEEMGEVDKFVEMDVSIELMTEIFKLYESTKTRRRVYDYTDMVFKVYDAIRNTPHMRDTIREYYQYVTVDEVQDFTPLMVALLKELVGDNVPLVCIGDEDQAIYGFRGADINTVLKFREAFDDGKVFVLNKNRRCGSVIVEKASVIIEENKGRYDKDLKAIREGGQVILKPYRTEKGQILNLYEYIKGLSSSERNGVAITYRDRVYSMELVELLEADGIPFNVISGHMPFSHELYKHVENVLDILYRPYNRLEQINLYKVLPMTKSEWFTMLGYNPSKKKFENSEDGVHFSQRDYGKYNTNETCRKDLQDLLMISKLIGTSTMDMYFDTIFEKILRNFWRAKLELNDKKPVDLLFTEKVRAFFNRKETYEDVFRDLARRRELCKAWSEKKLGITFSTFHGLKGLEFDEVHMIYMDNSIFPNFEAMSIKPLSKDSIERLQEAETRLCYVAMTRARDKLVLHYNSQNPSRYVVRLVEDKEAKETRNLTGTKPMELTLGEEDEHEEMGMQGVVYDFREATAESAKPTVSKDSFRRFF